MGTPKPKRLVELDGRTLEGGGQLLRNSLCLSALNGIPIKINNIRGNRSSGGGLKPQHLACVNWLAHACGAQVEGAEKGSKTLLFEPGKAPGYSATEISPAFKKTTSNGEAMYECRLDIGTAGATGLALQAVLPYILFSQFPAAHPVRLTLTGGTNVSGSPSYEYITQVLLPTLHAIGFPEIRSQIKRRGWSQGGSSIGEIIFDIPFTGSGCLSAFTLRPSPSEGQIRPTHFQATFIAPSSCHKHFRTVLIPALDHQFGKAFSSEAGRLDIACESSLHEKRIYFILVATISGTSNTSPNGQSVHKIARDWLYDRKIRSHERAATEMAERVANELRMELDSGAYVDDHMRDQLVIFQALAAGTSEVYPGVDGDGELREPSLHARTAEWVAKRLLGVTFDAASACDGVGFGGETEEEKSGNAAIKIGEIRIDEDVGRLSVD